MNCNKQDFDIYDMTMTAKTLLNRMSTERYKYVKIVMSCKTEAHEAMMQKLLNSVCTMQCQHIANWYDKYHVCFGLSKARRAYRKEFKEWYDCLIHSSVGHCYEMRYYLNELTKMVNYRRQKEFEEFATMTHMM